MLAGFHWATSALTAVELESASLTTWLQKRKRRFIAPDTGQNEETSLKVLLVALLNFSFNQFRFVIESLDMIRNDSTNFSLET